jgi:hypothetical protein
MQWLQSHSVASTVPMLLTAQLVAQVVWTLLYTGLAA